MTLLIDSFSGTLHIGTTGLVVPAISLSDQNNVPTVFNSGRLNTDFRILPTGNKFGLFFDVSTARLGINQSLPKAVLHVTDACEDGGMIIESSDNCANGVVLNLLHNPTTAPQTGDYPATINLKGVDTTDSEVIYAQIRSKILDPKAPQNGTGYISGELSFNINNTGLLVPVFVGSNQRTLVGFKNTQIDGMFETIVGANNYNRNGSNSTLVGNNNNAIDLKAGLLLGYSNVVSGQNNIVIVNLSKISGLNNLTFGSAHNTVGNFNSIIGLSGNIYGNNNMSFGNNNNVSGNTHLLYGNQLFSFGNRSINIGFNNTISGSNTIVIGNNQILSSDSGIYIGNDITNTNASNSILLGLKNSGESIPNTVLYGILNTVVGSGTDLVLVGHNNILNTPSGFVVIGQHNQLSGSGNNIMIGRLNALSGRNNNSITIGALNNRTGVVFNNDLVINNGFSNINTESNNGITIGTLNTVNGDGIVTIGFKNISNSGSNNILGNFNNVFSTRNNVLGGFNDIVGNNSIAIGNNTKSFGNNIVNIGLGQTYGSGSISIGNNGLVLNSHIIGNGNFANNAHNTVYGSGNTIGISDVYPFTVVGTELIIPTNTDINNNDILGLYLFNNTNSSSYITYVAAQKSITTNQDKFILPNPIAATLFHNSSNLNDNSSSSVLSGQLVVISGNNQIYGGNTILVGNRNTYANYSGIIIGNNNNLSGINLLILGNNIGYTGNNAVIIGSTPKNRTVFGDTRTLFNQAYAQSGLDIFANDSSKLATFDFTSKRIGINNNNPSYTLDVLGTGLFMGIVIPSGAVSGYVLTADSSGLGSWQQTTSTIGTTSGICIAMGNNSISGSDAFLYTAFNTGLNFYDSSIIFTPNSLTLRDGVSFYIKDSSDNEVFVVHTTGNGYAQANNLNCIDLKVSDSTVLPSALSGGFLYVTNQGLLSRPIALRNSIPFVNNNGTPSASENIRYFDGSGILGLSNNNDSDENFDDTDYDIILSSNNAQDTSFNHNKNLTNSFSIWANTTNNGGSPAGLHYSTMSGVLSINTQEPVHGYGFDDNTRLIVNGKTRTNHLKVGSSSVSGQYLRAIDTSGNVAFQDFSLPLNQIATYPVSTALIAGSNTYTVELTTKTGPNTDQSLIGGNGKDGGKTLVFRGGSVANERWSTTSNFRVRQGGCSDACYRGIELGERASLLNTDEMIAYAGGSFKKLSSADNPQGTNEYDGSSQFAMYQLRVATSGIQIKDLLTTYPQTTSVSSKNTIAFNGVVTDNGHSRINIVRNFVWQYNISLNAVWKNTINPAEAIDAACFVYEGAVKKIGNDFQHIGVPLSRSYLPEGGSPRPALTGIIKPEIHNSIPMLRIMASGGTSNYHIKWSATAQINQINLPDTAFGFID